MEETGFLVVGVGVAGRALANRLSALGADVPAPAGAAGVLMHLVSRGLDKLLTYMLAGVARRRKEQGLKLSHLEAAAVISAAALNGALAGKTPGKVMTIASEVLARADVTDGVADMIPLCG